MTPCALEKAVVDALAACRCPEPAGPARTLLATPIFSVVATPVRAGQSRGEAIFYSLEFPDWVNVVALTPEGSVVMVAQGRHGAGAPHLEIPGGVIEPGEKPLEAGLRELREETGYVPESAQLLGSVHPNPAIQGNRCHTVLALGARPSGEVAFDAAEDIHTLLVPEEAVPSLIRRGLVTNGLVLNAFHLHGMWRAERGTPRR